MKLSSFYIRIQTVVILAILLFFTACSSLPSLPGQSPKVDRTKKESASKVGSAPANLKLLNQHWEKGSQLFFNGEWQPAISEFSSALELSPKNAKILVARGWAYAKINQERLALNDFRQALQYEDLAEAHIGIAELAKAAMPRLNRRSEVFGAFNQGQQHYQRAISMSPDNEYLYYGLATLQYMQHHNKYISTPIALSYPLWEIQRAIQLRPDFVEALILEVQIKSELGQEAEAARAADRLLRLKPEYAEAYYIRGLVMSRTKNRPQAIAYARKALELDPGNRKYLEAIDEWQRPIPPTQGEILGAMSAVLLGAFLTSDPGQYTGPARSQYDPWGPNGYLNNWHFNIMMDIK